MDGITKECCIGNGDVCSLLMGQTSAKRTPKRWIAVLVQMNCEKKIATRLGDAGYETYVATQQEVHQWSDRKKKVDRLILPMIIFVRVTVMEEKWLRTQSYISKLISLPGSEESKRKLATPIPDYQIEQLRFLLKNADAEVSIVNDLKVGDAVKVISGPLKGLEGMVCEADEKHSLVGVLIDGLGYACVKIAKDLLS